MGWERGKKKKRINPEMKKKMEKRGEETGQLGTQVSQLKGIARLAAAYVD